MDPVTVWWAAPRDARPWHLDLLDGTERARRERYLRAADRDRFALGVVMTRLAAAPLLGVPPGQVAITRICADCGGPHGPPVVEGGPHVSVSHSGDRVALAVSPHGPVGVDVEELAARRHAGIGRYVLAPGEDAGGETALLTYWTRKEAVLKATRDGLRVAMVDVHVSAPDEPPRLLSWAGRPEMVARMDLRPLDPGHGHLACLAMIDQPDAPVRERPAAELF